jgi:hypothetical protein
MNTATKTLSPGYTTRRPVRYTTAAALDVLHPAELIWVMREWARFQGGPEDYDYSVIMEKVSPITHTTIWVMDRGGPESETILMLPSDN